MKVMIISNEILSGLVMRTCIAHLALAMGNLPGGRMILVRLL